MAVKTTSKAKPKTAAPAPRPFPDFSAETHTRHNGETVLRYIVNGKKYNIATIGNDGSLTLRPGNVSSGLPVVAGGKVKLVA